MQEILGHINDPGVDILSIVRAYGLPEEFPEDVMEEVSYAPEELSADYVAEEIGKNGRVDLRDVPMVTIDGEMRSVCRRRRSTGRRSTISESILRM